MGGVIIFLQIESNIALLFQYNKLSINCRPTAQVLASASDGSRDPSGAAAVLAAELDAKV